MNLFDHEEQDEGDDQKADERRGETTHFTNTTSPASTASLRVFPAETFSKR